ncbi:MAG: large-conductance mechanosensitive channel protein MscL, partial [Tidjanibacter sp.]|nr:large-conductance mechanosensitive channel protein MscL [Tidjanibacter sp.]
MAFLSDFKKFALKGNVVDMAVGVIIGGAFGKIVSSLVNDILMPPIGMLLGNVNFTDLALKIGGTAEAPVMWKYGAFIQNVVDFLIIALCVFLLILIISELGKKEKAAPAPAPAPAPEPKPTKEEILLTEIRD